MFSNEEHNQFANKVGQQDAVIEKRNAEITKLKKEKSQMEADLKSTKATLASAVSADGSKGKLLLED
jgi:hypothetical protein